MINFGEIGAKNENSVQEETYFQVLECLLDFAGNSPHGCPLSEKWSFATIQGRPIHDSTSISTFKETE